VLNYLEGENELLKMDFYKVLGFLS
jgi:hypothetical protein